MKNKFLFLFVLSLAAIATLLGCHAGGNAPFINVSGESNIVSMERIVNENGRFADITFPSGAVIKCPNEKTFKEGVKVTATEDRIPLITDNSGNFSYIYQYRISAVLPSENSLIAEVPVNTTEKPLKVSFPNNSTTGFCYIGTRASENDPWRYTLADDGGVGNTRLSRLSIKSPKTFYFDLYRFNIQFRLFVIDNEDSDKAKVDFVEVSTGSKENKISIENGKYAEDLEVKITLYGEKLDSIDADNLIARIIYRSQNLNPVQLKANGSIVKQNDYDDKAVTGGYEHSFEINNIKIDSSMSGETVLSFVLNLNGISIEDFPTNFLVEFYSDTKDEKALPFIYTRVLSFETKENQPEPVTTYTITYDLDGGEPTGNNPTSYDKNTDDITLSNPTKDGYTFTGWTGSNGDTPEIVVKIEKGSTGDKSYTANYSAIAYTITYTLGADDVTNDNPSGFNPDSETFTLKEPERTGYTFTGWSGTDLTGEANKQVTITKGTTGNKEYTAHWSINSYNLTINKGTGINTVTGAGSHEYNSSVTASCTMLAGYEFDSWTGDFTTETFNMPANNATMTANAKSITYTITLDPNGGTVEYTSKEYNVETAEFILPKATKDYYTFDGWVLNGGDPVETVTITKGTHENRTYKAKFTPATYTITLDPNGGTVEYTSKEYNVETAEFTLPTPTRTGYKFLGWILEGETTPVETVIIANGSTGAKTYTANWKLNLTLTIAQDDGVIIDEINDPPLYYTKATFTITPTIDAGAQMTDTEKANILSALSVKDSENNSISDISASWNNDGNIALSFSKDLTASTTFTISFGEIDGVNLTCEPKTFKTFYFKGKGVAANPCLVENAEQLDCIRNYLDKHYVQTADIDIATYNWLAIGADYRNKFKGCYYGNDKKIKNFTVHSSENIDTVGLFGYLSDGAKIASLTIDGVSVYGTDTSVPLNSSSVGVIAASVGKQCSIELCKVINSSTSKSVVFTSAYYVIGGICGENEGNISYCSVNNINIKNTNARYAGGICGANYFGSINSCSFEKSNFEVFLGTDFGNSFGGICGYNSGNILICQVDNESSLIGDANGNSNGFYIGGICGYQMASKADSYHLYQCYIDNVIVSGIGENCRIGGIFGMSGNVSSKNFTRVIFCHIYNSLVEGTGDYNSIGGIGGSNYGEVISCYTQLATATVKVSNESSCNTCNVGGIVGENCECPISKSYALNSSVIVNNSSRVGGISGWSNGTIDYCYVMNNDLKSGSECFMGGITGVNDGGGYIGSCYVLNSNFNTGNQSKIGGLVGKSESASIKSSYFSNDANHNITKGDSCNFGYIGGYVFNSSTVKNCFYRQSEDPFFGDNGNTISENNYKGISSYDEFTTYNSSPRTWSDGAWIDFKVGADKPWPLDLNDNPRKN